MIRIAGYSRGAENTVQYTPTNRRVKVGSFNVVESIREYFNANGVVGVIGKLHEASSDFINGITTMTYVLGSQTIDLKMTRAEEKNIYDLEDAVKRAVCARDFGITEADMDRVTIDLALNVWIDGEILIPRGEPGVQAAVRTLRTYMNGIIKKNICRFVEDQDDKISRDGTVVANLARYNELTRRLRISTEIDAAGRRHPDAIILGDTTRVGHSLSVPDFKDLLVGAGLTRADGGSQFPEMEKLHTLLCRLNDVPVEDNSYATLMRSALEKSRKKLSGFMGFNTFKRRTSRKFDRLATKITRHFDESVRTPGEKFQTRAELNLNYEDLRAGRIVNFDRIARGDTATASLEMAQNAELVRCQKFRDHRGAAFILEAIKHCYLDLDRAFVENPDNKEGQRRALHKAYALLSGIYKPRKPNAYTQIPASSKAFVLEALAYAVPNARTQDEFIRFLKEDMHQSINVEELDQAAFVQQQLVERRRSLEDDTRSAWVKYSPARFFVDKPAVLLGQVVTV